MATMVTAVRPSRSAYQPPAAAPTAPPSPIAAKAARGAHQSAVAGAIWRAKAAARKTGSHAHMA